MKFPCPARLHGTDRQIGLDIATGQIHIWKVNLDTEKLVEDQQSILSCGEQQRAARFILQNKRSWFQAAHCALRKILSGYLNKSPEDIQFQYGPAGKPYCIQTGRGERIEFNLAHADHLMLLAVTLGVPVGIDLERHRSISAREWILKQYFSGNDLAAFRNLPAADQDSAFLSAWTAREACGKLSGNGLANPSQTDHLVPGLERALPDSHYETYLMGSSSCLRFNPDAGFSACAAVQSAHDLQPYFWVFSEISKEDMA